MRHAGPAEVAVALALLATTTGCTTRIRGVVRDQVTGEPVSNASVRVSGQSTATTGTGYYEVKLKRDSYYLLTVTKLDYQTHSVSIQPDLATEDEGDLVRDVGLYPEGVPKPAPPIEVARPKPASEPEQAKPSHSTCYQCDATLNQGAKFCRKCGVRQ